MDSLGAEQPIQVSVVVITRDGADSVSRLLTSLRQQGLSQAFEVIIVDDGSSIPLAGDLVPSLEGLPFSVEYIRRDPGGNRSAARNVGADRARGELLVFADGDQEAPPQWISEHLRWQEPVEQVLVVGHRREHVEDEQESWRPEVRERVTAEFSDNYRRISCPWYFAFSGNMSIKKSDFEAVGGFDDGFKGWGFEDVEFGYRASKLGIETAYNPHAWTWDATHVVRTDSQRQEQWAANRDYFLTKHQDPVAQAIQLVDHYPADPDLSRGQAWLESFKVFEDHVRELQGRERLSDPVRTVTVLKDDDIAYAKRLISDGESVRIFDGVKDSGLDVFTHLAKSKVFYKSLVA